MINRPRRARPSFSALHPIPLWTMVVYGLPYLSYAVVALPLALLVPSFYAEERALPLAWVGLAIAASRLLDVITDPIIGTLSDRWRSRWGRRKPWVALGAPLFMVSIWMVFVPPAEAGVTYLFIWTALLFLAFTFLDLPYKAWGAELSTDYSERSRVTAWREAFGFGGQLVSVLIIMGIGRLAYRDIGLELRVIALMMMLSLPLLLALAFWLVPERRPDSEALGGDRTQGWWWSVLILARNPAFLRMLGSVVLFVSGIIIQATLHRLVMIHITGTPELFAIMLLIENIATIAAVPIWLRVSDRIGKHRALSLAALWVGLWSLVLPLVGPGQGWPLIAILAIRGTSFASILLLANSIVADVVDHDTVASGRQRTGLHFAAWAMTYKLAIGLGVLLATTVPAYYGFEPADPIQGPNAKLALRAVYGWLPGLLMMLGALFLWNFPIDKRRQEELRALIASRALD